MAAAVAGGNYLVEKNDWLSTIAGEAYGDIYKWGLIANANPQINGRGVAVDGSPLIFPRDILYIPVEAVEEESESSTFASQQEKSFSVAINGEKVAIVSGTLQCSMDLGADVVECVVDLDSLSDATKEALKPFRYPEITVKINGELRLTGYVYVVEPTLSSSGKTKKITGCSKTADLIDSTVNPPFVQSGVTLANRAKVLCETMGITAVFASGASEMFDKITASEGEKRFDHLSKLAKERGLLVSCTVHGNLLFHKTSEDETPLDSISESEFGATDFSAKFDGRKRFSSYRVTGKNLFGEVITKTEVDPFVSRPRYLSKKASRSTREDIETTVSWERSKAIADALSISIPLDSWETKKGELWVENKFVFVTSETLDLSNGVNLLIRRVRYSYSKDGKKVTLDVVPKEVYTGGDITDIFS